MHLIEVFSGFKFFSLYGLIAVIVVVIPNFIFAKKGQSTRPDDLASVGVKISMIEFLSRIVLTIVLVCLRYPNNYEIFGILAGVTLLIYFILWGRYFKNGCYYPDIYMKSFIGLPVPIDVFNVVYFIFVSLWLGNFLALILAVVYGICRILNADAALKDLKTRI